MSQDSPRPGSRAVYEPVHLQSFLAVASTLSFTQAAQQLGSQQSTVSGHIRKLENAVGRTLFVRDTRTVQLTADGEAMIGHARAILAAQQDAVAFFSGPKLSGRLRFGVSDDLALTALPRILREFRGSHPGIHLDLFVGQSPQIHRRLEAGHLDVAYVKHQPGDPSAAIVRRDRLVWAAASGIRIDPDLPVPLISYPAPSMSRALSIRALEAEGRTYRITCTVRGVNGVLAAVRAGLGVGVFADSLTPADLVELRSEAGLPDLGDIDFVLLTGPRAPDEAARTLCAAILSNVKSMA